MRQLDDQPGQRKHSSHRRHWQLYCQRPNGLHLVPCCGAELAQLDKPRQR